MLQIVLNAVRKITNRLNRIKINSIRAKVVLKHTKTRPNPAIIIRDQITGKSLKISTVCSPLCSMIPQMVITMVRQAWPTSMSSRGTPALPTRPPTRLLTWWTRLFQDWMPQTVLMDPIRKTSTCLGRPAPHNMKWDIKEVLSLTWTWVAQSPMAPDGRDNQTSWMDQRMVGSFTQGTAEPHKMYQVAMATRPWLSRPSKANINHTSQIPTKAPIAARTSLTNNSLRWTSWVV